MFNIEDFLTLLKSSALVKHFFQGDALRDNSQFSAIKKHINQGRRNENIRD